METKATQPTQPKARRSKLVNAPRTDKNVSKLQFLHRYFFPGMPDNYSLRKKLQITKNTSQIGVIYDMSQDFCSVLMCGVYVLNTYYDSYEAVHNIFDMDVAITAYVLVDILFNWYLHGSAAYFLKFTAIVDLISVFPTFFGATYSILFRQNMSVFMAQMISTLRLIRVIRIFKTLRFFYSIRRAEMKLGLTLFCMIFVTAGIVQFCENDYRQRFIECEFINRNTHWLPSCSHNTPADELVACDCAENNCGRLYAVSFHIIP